MCVVFGGFVLVCLFVSVLGVLFRVFLEIHLYNIFSLLLNELLKDTNIIKNQHL